MFDLSDVQLQESGTPHIMSVCPGNKPKHYYVFCGGGGEGARVEGCRLEARVVQMHCKLNRRVIDETQPQKGPGSKTKSNSSPLQDLLISDNTI